jgi:putative drug exporter of the RND superfamily
LLLRYPRAVLATATLLLAVLGVIGTGVDSRLSPTSLDIPGTPSSRANTVLREHFGRSAPFAVLLRGPAPALDRQGPELVRALRASDPRITTLSPWDRGSVGRLRPSPRQALIVLDFHVGLADSVNNSVDELDAVLDEQIRPPVRATQTGYATLSRAIQDESIEAAERSELIALPILLVVLLLVFRSPIAAAIPLVFGAVTVASSRGLLYIFTGWFDIDAFALTVCTMMGLALGVDYALLMVSRFREELANGTSPMEAATVTRRTAGRTTVFAGSTLLLSMLVAFFIVPGSLLASLAATVALVVVLSVLVATIAGPAVLTLLGPNLDRWRMGGAPAERSGLMAVVTAALRRPVPVALAIGAVVLLLAGPALALKTGPPSPEQLDESNQARADSELLARSVGPGFESPFVIVAATDNGPITEPDRLEALSRWQRKIAALPGVQAVIGPARVSEAVTPLREQGKTLLAGGEDGPLANVNRVGRSLARATVGIGQVRGGIQEAANGAGLLADGSGRAEEGAQALARGLGRATGGTRALVGALGAFSDGTARLARVQQRLALGSVVLKTGVTELIPNLRRNALSRSRRLQKSLNEKRHDSLPALKGPAEVADEQLKTALQQLDAMTVGKGDPTYAAALAAVRQAAAAVSGTDPASGQPYAEGYAGLPAELNTLQAGLDEDASEAQQVTSWLVTGVEELKRLSTLAGRLSDAAQRLVAADRKLAREAERLEDAVAPVGDGISRLSAGATVLAAGIAQLTGGTEALSRSLAEGYGRSYPLQAGLRRASVRILSTGTSLDRRADRLRRRAPGLFDSGYFVLSALDGASTPLRDRAAEGIDLENSGQAATLLVFSRYALNSPGSIAFNERLNEDAAALGREAGVTTGVGGGPATLNDYSRVTRERFPLVVVAITIATFLVLILILRSIPLAAIAVGLNLATVGVAFGILTILTEFPDSWPLGGHAYVDSVGATMIFGIVFGLSIDYAVFLLVRMREHYDREGDNRAAIMFGLEKTARVITGAAAIMMAVFVVFAGASIATVSQLGVGLTVAVLLDASVVRIVLLPALMLMLGDRVWWLPKWMDRALPRLNV